MPVFRQPLVGGHERDYCSHAFTGESVNSQPRNLAFAHSRFQPASKSPDYFTRVATELPVAFDFGLSKMAANATELRFDYAIGTGNWKVATDCLIAFKQRTSAFYHKVRRGAFVFPWKLDRFEVSSGKLFIEQARHLDSIRQHKALSVSPDEQPAGARIATNIYPVGAAAGQPGEIVLGVYQDARELLCLDQADEALGLFHDFRIARHF
jgi:hypothetical protein